MLFLTITYLVLLFIKEILHSLHTLYQSGNTALLIAVTYNSPKMVELLINPWHACAARVTVLGLCVCVSVSVCVCLHLFSPYRDQASSSAIPTALAQQGLENLCGDLLRWRHLRDMALKQATKPPTSTDHYRFRLSGTLLVL